jgi:hypothetical protein
VGKDARAVALHRQHQVRRGVAADRWFLSLSVDVDFVLPMRENQTPGGVDLGNQSP